MFTSWFSDALILCAVSLTVPPSGNSDARHRDNPSAIIDSFARQRSTNRFQDLVGNPSYLEFETLFLSEDGSLGAREITRIFTDSDRLRIDREVYPSGRSEAKDPTFRSISYIDQEANFEYRWPFNQLLMEVMGSDRDSLLLNIEPIAISLGMIVPIESNVWQELLAADDKSILEIEDLGNGHPGLQVDFQSASGDRYRTELDAGHGYQLHSLVWERTASSSKTTMALARYEVSDCEFQDRGNGIWLLSSATVNIQFQSPTAQLNLQRRYSLVASGVLQSPLNVSALNIPEDTEVFWGRQQTSGVRYRWAAGRIEPLSDQTLIKSIDDTVLNLHKAHGDSDRTQIDGTESSSAGSVLRWGENTRSTPQSGPYCGINCLYAALKLIGSNPHYPSLVQEKWIGSPEGSSIKELRLAAQTYGAHAESRAHLNLGDLKMISSPAILHVKHTVYSPEPDHYVLYLGKAGSRIVLWDIPNHIYAVPIYELDSIWDGAAIIISQPNAPHAASIGHIMYVVACLGLIVIGSPVMLRFMRSRMLSTKMLTMVAGHSRASRIASESCAIVVLALLVGVAYHWWQDTGMLDIRSTSDYLRKYYALSGIPDVDLAGTRRHAMTSAMIIDVRSRREYNDGHIPGAVNIPIGASDGTIIEQVGGQRRSSGIVVYCSSSGCDFATRMARRMITLGILDVAVFKGGWEAWSAAVGDGSIGR